MISRTILALKLATAVNFTRPFSVPGWRVEDFLPTSPDELLNIIGLECFLADDNSGASPALGGVSIQGRIEKMANTSEQDGVQGTPSAREDRPESKTTPIQPSWDDLQAEFLQYAAEYAELSAVWTWTYPEATVLAAIAFAVAQGPDVGPWDFLRRAYRDPDLSSRPPAPKGQWNLEGGSPVARDLFRVIAGRAAGRSPNPSNAEPWRLWLNRLREKGYAPEMPARAMSGQIVGPYPDGFEDRRIENIFKVSAEFCRVRSLADRYASPSQQPMRPEICFESWGEIPSDDPSATAIARDAEGQMVFLQRGFQLVNDGGTAHEITVEPFEIEPSVQARSKTVARIPKDGMGFALIWLDGFLPWAFDYGKWDLIGAMASAWNAKYGNSMYSPDYGITVSVRYRDSEGRWYRSSAAMTYIASQKRLEFGPTTHTVLQPIEATKPPSTVEQGSTKTGDVKANTADSGSGGGITIGPSESSGARETSTDDLGRANVGLKLDSLSWTPDQVRPRRTPDLDSSRERLALVGTLARELAIIKQELKGYCTVDGLKRKHPKFTLWTLIEDSQIKALVDGEAFVPKAYAENLTLSKFGLTSRETLKKDRQKLRKAKKAGQQ